MTRRSTGLLTSTVRERRVPLRGRITKQIACCCIARMLVLATEDRQRPIVTYIDSPDGSISQSLAVRSTMDGIKCPVATFCRGQIGIAGILIGSHGMKGARTASTSCVISLALVEEASSRNGDAGGEPYLQLVAEALARDTHRSETEVQGWLRQKVRFTAQEALAHGLIDHIAEAPVVPKTA
jgi:ATP-dependent Clp protease, protease subunit